MLRMAANRFALILYLHMPVLFAPEIQIWLGTYRFNSSRGFCRDVLEAQIEPSWTREKKKQGKRQSTPLHL
jgi:hypothetical protein